jgi:hypothetical protein
MPALLISRWIGSCQSAAKRRIDARSAQDGDSLVDDAVSRLIH